MLGVFTGAETVFPKSLAARRLAKSVVSDIAHWFSNVGVGSWPVDSVATSRSIQARRFHANQPSAATGMAIRSSK